MAGVYVFSMLLVLLGAQRISGQGSASTPVCISLQPDGNIPDVRVASDFSVKMEVVSQETQRVINMIMYYSKIRNQIRLQMLDQGRKSDMYFYFADNEILTFDYSVGRGVCTVNNNLKQSPDTFIVGGTKDGRIQVPLAVLHFVGNSGFGQNPIVNHYMGTTTVRDMDVMAFTSCQQWTFGPQNATVNVTHYFSEKDWSRFNSRTVPVSVEVHGKVFLHGSYNDMDHFYNFFDFQGSIDPAVFETPPGVVCKNRNVDKPFPNLPNYIKLSGESVDLTEDITISYFDTIYDPADNLAYIRSQGQQDFGTMGGMDHFTVIRDYASGVSYNLDNVAQTCAVQNISQSTPLPFDYITPRGKEQMVTPEMLFLADKAKYTYIGERKIRGIDTDTWVTKTNLPQYPDKEVTVEWYFAKGEPLKADYTEECSSCNTVDAMRIDHVVPMDQINTVERGKVHHGLGTFSLPTAQTNVRSWNDGSQLYKDNNYRMPVLMRTWKDDSNPLSVDTNVYHVDFTRIMTGVVDVRNCYLNKKSNYFKLFLKNANKDVVNKNIEQFKWGAITTLRTAAKVRTLRIADLRVYYEGNSTIIEFELLDAPPHASDASIASGAIPSLAEATKNLQKVISAGALTFNAWDPVKKAFAKPFTATASSVIEGNKPPPKPSDGYSVGSFAGLGVGMVLVGGIVGGVGGHFFIK